MIGDAKNHNNRKISREDLFVIYALKSIPALLFTFISYYIYKKTFFINQYADPIIFIFIYPIISTTYVFYGIKYRRKKVEAKTKMIWIRYLLELRIVNLHAGEKSSEIFHSFPFLFRKFLHGFQNMCGVNIRGSSSH